MSILLAVAMATASAVPYAGFDGSAVNEASVAIKDCLAKTTGEGKGADFPFCTWRGMLFRMVNAGIVEIHALHKNGKLLEWSSLCTTDKMTDVDTCLVGTEDFDPSIEFEGKTVQVTWGSDVDLDDRSMIRFDSDPAEVITPFRQRDPGMGSYLMRRMRASHRARFRYTTKAGKVGEYEIDTTGFGEFEAFLVAQFRVYGQMTPK